VLRRTFGPKGYEMIGDWGKLYNDLHNLYASPSIIRIIKSRKIRWAGYVAPMGANRNTYRTTRKTCT
jgi:hypothetical protein